MDKFIRLQKKIAPELSEILEERFNILKIIREQAPIGRRALAATMHVGERLLRAQLDFLREGELVSYSQHGAALTPAGEEVYNSLGEYIRLFRGLSFLQNELSAMLTVDKLVIVPGDAGADRTAMRDLGRATAEILQANLFEDTVLATGGGSCVAATIGGITRRFPAVQVVAARGSSGSFVEYQANWVAVNLAERLGATYSLLFAYDGLADAALQSLLLDDNIAAYKEKLQKVGVVIFGVSASVSSNVKDNDNGAIVGEALGQYFSLTGEWLSAASSLGVGYEQLKATPMKILVADGYEKASAIVAVCRALSPQAVVIDEGAARGIAEIL